MAYTVTLSGTTGGTVMYGAKPCPYCGNIHRAKCPEVKAIEYYKDGTIKRVEYITPGDYMPAFRGNSPLDPPWIVTTSASG